MAAPVFAYVAASTHDVKVHKFAAGSATAECPKGRHVAFGGIVAQYQPPGSGAKYVLPMGMRRTADNQFTVYGFNNTRKTEGHLTAVAYCDNGSVPRAVEKTAVISAEVGSVTATCPAGTVVVGGGYDAHASPNHVLVVDALQRPSATTWRVTGASISDFGANVTAIAYCAPGIAPKRYSATVKVAGNTGGTARVSCPGGTSLVFGGVMAQKTGFWYEAAHSARVEAFSWTAASDTEWVVTGFNVGSRTGDLVALAYCR